MAGPSVLFCAVRPPGHHAEADQAMGFCLFNNVAIGAEYLLEHNTDSRRIAIVDIDVRTTETERSTSSPNDPMCFTSACTKPTLVRRRFQAVATPRNAERPRAKGTRLTSRTVAAVARLRTLTHCSRWSSRGSNRIGPSFC